MPQSLYQEMNDAAKSVLAALLGFTYTEDSAAGFRDRLRDIPAFGRDFTVGEALTVYTGTFGK